jgi:hypothetical protein
MMDYKRDEQLEISSAIFITRMAGSKWWFLIQQ